MPNQAKIDHILKDFPILENHTDMVMFILDIREAFKLDKVPFEVKVGKWSSGSLVEYYKNARMKIRAERLKKKGRLKKSFRVG